MVLQVRLHPASFSRAILRIFVPVGLSMMLCLTASAQAQPTCTNSTAQPPLVSANGLAELVGDIVFTCTGGTAGAPVNASLFVALNTAITNTLDAGNNPLNLTVTAFGANVTSDPISLISSTTLSIANLTYTVPLANLLPVTITISGIRAAIAPLRSTQTQIQVNATLVGLGIGVPSNPFPVAVAVGNAPLLSSVVNNGVACLGSSLPDSLDFASFSLTTSSSAVRVTESYSSAFAPRAAAADNGTRILIQLSGYPAGTQLWVPDALVGSSGTIPTSAGEFATFAYGGTYTPIANQLLFARVMGADANGAGGLLFMQKPTTVSSFTSMTQLTLINGSAYVAYEVLDQNPQLQEAVQVPVFVANGQSDCSNPAPATLLAMEAPVSTVAVASSSDPAPRYVAAPLTSDCNQTGDCSQGYFPVLSIDATPITIVGSSLGLAQKASLAVLNNGGSALSYTTSISYGSGGGWLKVTPASADVAAGALTLTVTADPGALQPGSYAATITVNAGPAGTASAPVTFTVGPPGPLISAIVNAASSQPGAAIAPGSFAALYGLNLAATNLTVTFNGISATILPIPSPGNQTQINLIVPGSLSTSSTAQVVVTADGKTSNTYKATLAANAPGIFTPGIVNPDASTNSSSHPGQRGSYVQVYLTGLATPVTGTVTVTMGSQTGIVPLYADVAPTLAALDQVNVTIPVTLASTGNSVPLSVCIAPSPSASTICSNLVTLYVQ